MEGIGFASRPESMAGGKLEVVDGKIEITPLSQALRQCGLLKW